MWPIVNMSFKCIFGLSDYQTVLGIQQIYPEMQETEIFKT